MASPFDSLPPEFAQELAAIERRKQIAQMMQQGAMQPMQPQVIGGHYVKQNPLTHLARALTGVVAGQTLSGLDKESAGIASRAGKSRSDMMGMLSQTTDPRARIALAMSSGDPALQAAAMKWMDKQNEPETLGQPITVMGPSGPQLAQFGNRGGINPISGLSPKPEMTSVNGQIVDILAQGGPQVKGDFRDKYGSPQDLRGDLYQPVQGTGQLKKLDNAPKTTVKIDNRAEPEFDKAFGRESGKDLAEGVASRPGAVNAITSLQKSRQLLSQGIYTGIAADLKKTLAKAGNELTFSDAGKAARTEQFLTELGEVVLPRLKDIGGNDTKEEREYIERTVGGQISMEPQAIMAALESAERKIRAKASVTEATAKRWKAAGKAGVPSVEELQTLPPELAPTQLPEAAGLPPPPPGVKWITK